MNDYIMQKDLVIRNKMGKPSPTEKARLGLHFYAFVFLRLLRYAFGVQP